jgi:hypothetical protein
VVDIDFGTGAACRFTGTASGGYTQTVFETLRLPGVVSGVC